MKRRLISILLTIAMVVTMFPVAALAEGTGQFRDVKKTDWYYEAVEYVTDNGLFSGVGEGSFAPEGTMTRGMFVTVLGRMAGVDTRQYVGSTGFSDVPADAWYAPYVMWAVRYGITEGTGGGRFSPDAPIDRQQLACFFVRYFDAFGVTFEAQEAPDRAEPADMDSVAPWAEDAVLQMWESGLLIGDGTCFEPAAKATRAQTATLCQRLDQAVLTWFTEPGEPTHRIVPDEVDEDEDERIPSKRQVSFYDGDRLIDVLEVRSGRRLQAVPSVEKSSKEGAVLVGYYYDEEFTQPFRGENQVLDHMNVYAKYQEMETPEELTVRTYTLMDQEADLSFVICRSSDPVSGEAGAARAAAAVQSKDGSDPVAIEAEDNGDGTYTVYAPEGFPEGCSYELTLADGWIFDGKEPSIRTASFSIAMEEVENLRMGDGIIYIEDTADMDYTVDGEEYPVLTSEVMELLQEEEGSFFYDGEEVEEGDVLCVYTGVHPEEREMNSDLLAPAIYVRVTEAEDGQVFFAALDEESQQELYEVPDNFPILVSALPEEETGTVSLTELDLSMYESMVGKEEGTLEKAGEKLSVGDFVTLYVSDLDTPLTGAEEELYFGRVEAVDGDEITYVQVTRQDIIDSMDLYANIDLEAADLLSDGEMENIRLAVLSQVESSGFAEEAAELLMDLAMESEEVRQDGDLLQLLASSQRRAGGRLGANDVDLTVRVGSGSRYGGVSIGIGVAAAFVLEAEDGQVHMSLSAEFEEEVMIAPGVKGNLVYKEILGIPVPIGVYVSAHVDVKNFTGFSFAAEAVTKDGEGSVLNTTSVTSNLDEIMAIADQTGLSENYEDALEALLEQYSRMVSQESDWIQLVEEELFSTECNVYGLALGVSADFVVRTDMSIAIGSSLQYEVGKRYSVWFKIGLFEPTAGSDTMDLIDEQFAFRFYVMGKLGVKAGIKAKIYAGLGSGKVASVGLAAELGPYIKLWGLFIYDYTRLRPAGMSQWITDSRMMGGLNLEFGLYLILSFEAEALELFEYSYDFLNEEYPLLTSGDPKYYYDMNYQPTEEETVYIWDEDRDMETGVTMALPDSLRVLKFLDLKTGVRGTDLLGYENFVVTLSNENFRFDKDTGKVSVTVSPYTHIMHCDATITYLHGKMAFSNYDISTTVHLVWTDLSLSELKEYHTAFVRVGNDETGYKNVWSKKVLRGESFDLPTDEEIRQLAGWSDLKYVSAEGYKDAEQTTGLTITQDTMWSYVIEPRTFEITVEGIQNPDGSEAEPRTYTAKYGEVFDFSDLEATGTDDPEEGVFTAFTHVTTEETMPGTLTVQPDGSGQLEEAPLDLTLPIVGTMAEVLKSGDVVAQANYMDASTTAVFTFNGLTHEDVVVKLRKGTVPSMAAVEEVLEQEVLKQNGQPLGISELYPALSTIDRSTNYIVTCTGLDGSRSEVRFDPCGGEDVEPVDKLTGSLIVNIPEAVRRGYTFRGWFTEPEGEGQDAFTQTVPEDGITLYALWTPNTYRAEFHMNGGDGNVPEPVLVTYDDTYGNGNVQVPSEEGYVKGEAYGDLPIPTYTGYKFLGWSTMPNRRADGAERVEEDTVADIYDSDHVLYAQWKKLEVIPENAFVFGGRQYTTYDGSPKTAEYTINTGLAYNDEDYDGGNVKYFTEELLSDAQIVYMRQGILSEWESEPTNAGIYNAKITRPADGNFTGFTGIYYGVLEVEKAESSMRDTPTASCIDEMYYGNLLMNPDRITNYTGDGAVQYAVTSSSSKTPSESDWTTGIVYNGDTSGSFWLWTRLSEGVNYKASNAVCSASAISRTGSAPKQLINDEDFWYFLQVTTSTTDKAGTDSGVFASIGNNTGRVKLDQEGEDDHENGDSRRYQVWMEDFVPNATSSINVTISLDKGGNKPGWKLGSLQLHLYKKTGNGLISDLQKGPVLSSDKLTANDWFLTDDYPRSSKTYTLTGLGRNLNLSISGPTGSVDVTKGGTTTLSISETVSDTRRGGMSYNGYQRKFAPEFTASFTQDQTFDRYLTWSHENGSWKVTVDNTGLYSRMMEEGMYQLTLSYGVKEKGLQTVYFSVPMN